MLTREISTRTFEGKIRIHESSGYSIFKREEVGFGDVFFQSFLNTCRKHLLKMRIEISQLFLSTMLQAIYHDRNKLRMFEQKCREGFNSLQKVSSGELSLMNQSWCFYVQKFEGLTFDIDVSMGKASMFFFTLKLYLVYFCTLFYGV